MKLVLPLKREWKSEETPAGTVVEIAPDVTLTIEAFRPLPFDVPQWRERVVRTGLRADTYRAGEMTEGKVDDGWAVTLMESEALDPASFEPAESRVHAFYQFLQFGCVAIVRSKKIGLLKEMAEPIAELLLKGRPDWQSDEIICLQQLTEDMTIDDSPLGDEGAPLANLLAGWRRHILAGGVLLLPPEGMAAGAVRIREKMRPLKRMKDAVNDILVESGSFFREHAKVGPLTLLMTTESEHAGIVTIASRAPTPNAEYIERIVAMVVGDDYYACIDTAAQKGFDHFQAVVRSLTSNYFLGLGELRRRRYVYRPPAGWQGIGRAHASHFYHPRYPRESGVINVFDARPLLTTVAESEDRLVFVDNSGTITRDATSPPEPINADSGLTGLLHTIQGRLGEKPMTLLAAHLQDDRFAYIVQLEVATDRLAESRPAYEALLRSIEPIPSLSGKRGTSLVHWAD